MTDLPGEGSQQHDASGQSFTCRSFESKKGVRNIMSFSGDSVRAVKANGRCLTTGAWEGEWWGGRDKEGRGRYWAMCSSKLRWGDGARLGRFGGGTGRGRSWGGLRCGTRDDAAAPNPPPPSPLRSPAAPPRPISLPPSFSLARFRFPSPPSCRSLAALPLRSPAAPPPSPLRSLVAPRRSAPPPPAGPPDLVPLRREAGTKFVQPEQNAAPDRPRRSAKKPLFQRSKEIKTSLYKRAFRDFVPIFVFFYSAVCSAFCSDALEILFRQGRQILFRVCEDFVPVLDNFVPPG